MKLEQIAKALGGTVVGDASLEVRRAVHPSEAENNRDLALAMDAGLVDCLARQSTSPASIANARSRLFSASLGCTARLTSKDASPTTVPPNAFAICSSFI